MAVEKSIFKTPEDEKKYMALYNTILAKWNVPVEPLDIITRYGKTHINIAGPKDGPPMLLIPGFSANSVMWFPNAAVLSSKFRIYAVDTNGQPGRSIPDETLNTSNSSDWMARVIDALQIEKAIVVGISLGGWLTLKFAIEKPERAKQIVLLDPAASFEGVSRSFFFHSFIPIMMHPTRAGLKKYFNWITRGYQVDKNWGELMISGILNTRPQPPIRATPFSDSELLNLHVPTLLLIGGCSVIYLPKRAYERACRLVPGIQAEIIQNASHALNAEAAELVNARIMQFCQASDGIP
jgi:pimeloyl-ACP methyl ester carboxylesterase